MTSAKSPLAPRTRVTKDPAVRREELLDVALELCRTEGFDAIRIEQIVSAAGVAKGTFYHYFAAKDDLLEALVLRFGESLMDHLAAAPTDQLATATLRLRAVMDASAQYKLAHGVMPMASFLYRPENLTLRHRLFDEWRERTRTLLLPLISGGIADGSFAVHSAEVTTDLVLLLWFDAADQLWTRGIAAADVASFTQVMLDGAVAISEAQERLLGVPAGTFTVPIGPEAVEMIGQLFTSVSQEQ